VIPHLVINDRTVLSAVGTAILFCAAASALAAPPEHKEQRFAVKGRPTVVLQNIVDGRIEVKSSKNAEVVVVSTSSPEKVAIDLEQVGDRIDISATGLINSTQPHEVEAPDRPDLRRTSERRYATGKRCRRREPQGSLRVYHRENHRRFFEVHTMHR
jgi:hypothetical protein